MEHKSFDVDSIRARHDLRDIARRLLGEPVTERRSYSQYRCFSHQDEHPSLSVKEKSFRCFGCGIAGDCIRLVTLVMFANEPDNMAFVKACRYLEGDTDQLSHVVVVTQAPEPERVSGPPSDEFQAALEAIVDRAKKALRGPAGRQAYRYLRESRGLSDQVLDEGEVGYAGGSNREAAASWYALAGDLDLWLGFREGVLFPWRSGGVLWGVKVRRIGNIEKHLRYTQITATDTRRVGAFHPCLGSGLYLADGLRQGSPGFLIEGEINCLTANQEAGDLIRAVSMGAALEQLDERWRPALAGCSDLYCLYDDDAAGHFGVAHALAYLPFKSVSLPGLDLNALHTKRPGAVREKIQEILCLSSTNAM